MLRQSTNDWLFAGNRHHLYAFYEITDLHLCLSCRLCTAEWKCLYALRSFQFNRTISVIRFRYSHFSNCIGKDASQATTADLLQKQCFDNKTNRTCTSVLAAKMTFACFFCMGFIVITSFTKAAMNKCSFDTCLSRHNFSQNWLAILNRFLIPIAVCKQ